MDRRAGLWAAKGLAPEAKAAIDAPLLALMGPPAEARVAAMEAAHMDGYAVQMVRAELAEQKSSAKEVKLQYTVDCKL